MKIERVSIKTLTVGILLILGLLSAALSLIASLYFREEALTSQAQSLSRIIEVASREIIKELRDQSTSFGNTLQAREEFRRALADSQESGQPEKIAAQLDDPFRKGFGNMGTLDLAKLRIYDLDLKLLHESREGVSGLEPRLPEFLRKQAAGRQGVERLKTLGGLWISPVGPFYSVLVPIGGIRISAYLEVVVNPAFNLAHVSALTEMPLKIYSMNGKLLHQSEQTAAGNKAGEGIKLPVEYLLMAQNGKPAYRLVGLEDVTRFSSAMYQTQAVATLSFLALSGLSLLLALWAFNRFMFRPINHIMDDIRHYTEEGSLTATTVEGSAKEFHALSGAFADMTGKIRSNILELERLSSLDGLTGVANRRSLDAALDKEWQRARREGTELSLMMIDMDFFKAYNDRYGHQAGDDCLKSIADTISRIVKRPADLVARYGGEEFAVLLPATSAEGAMEVARQIMDAVAKLHIDHAASEISRIATLSIGISTLKADKETNPYYLVGFADEALYLAKESGRNQIKTAGRESLTQAG